MAGEDGAEVAAGVLGAGGGGDEVLHEPPKTEPLTPDVLSIHLR